MKIYKILFGLFTLLVLSGCASVITQEQYEECIWRTSIAGAAIGGAVGNVGGAAAGTAGGALLGSFICGNVGESAPMPAPEPEISGNYLIPDGDNDGVRDEYDQCPFTPPGVAVDENGCANDNDGDGVPDYLDKCPETPLGTPVDENGCSRILVSLKSVHFNFDSATLKSGAKAILDRAVPAINAHSSSSFKVEGHTDSTGDAEYNQGLSQRRAQSVVDYLVSKGVSSSRLRAVGMGESSPVASNDTAAGRRENRRVEVIAQ